MEAEGAFEEQDLHTLSCSGLFPQSHGLNHYDLGCEKHTGGLGSDRCRVFFQPTEAALQIGLDGFGADVGHAASLDFYTLEGTLPGLMALILGFLCWYTPQGPILALS